MHDQARRFVDNQNVGVFKSDLQWHRLRHADHAKLRLRDHPNLLTPVNTVFGPQFLPIHRDITL